MKIHYCFEDFRLLKRREIGQQESFCRSLDRTPTMAVRLWIEIVINNCESMVKKVFCGATRIYENTCFAVTANVLPVFIVQPYNG
jgi:hypothetical protein